MSTPSGPARDPEPHRPDPGGGEHHRPGHAEPEGEYQDRDVTPAEPDTEAVGSYVDRDVTPGEQEQPPDEGEYTDVDAGTEPPRAVPAEGGFTDVDPDEVSHHRLTEERDDTHG
jgi:hypothetical protein